MDTHLSIEHLLEILFTSTRYFSSGDKKAMLNREIPIPKLGGVLFPLAYIRPENGLHLVAEILDQHGLIEWQGQRGARRTVDSE
ncbi:hypothetical protein CFB44_14725 [Burkholderia sp. AU31280]|nr:hypothetical protein CFB44_14725 [Burkholderia sp. AU31280]